MLSYHYHFKAKLVFSPCHLFWTFYSVISQTYNFVWFRLNGKPVKICSPSSRHNNVPFLFLAITWGSLNSFPLHIIWVELLFILISTFPRIFSAPLGVVEMRSLFLNNVSSIVPLLQHQYLVGRPLERSKILKKLY